MHRKPSDTWVIAYYIKAVAVMTIKTLTTIKIQIK
jgi:hypothetical protein